MQAIKNKIRSRRGASLTFALLLFLVCAVVGSVVLVAGTAASGRMSQIAEMDQRYYSVNSAARLLIDTIDGEEITIVETEPAVGSASYKYGDGSDLVIDGKFDSVAKEAAAFYIHNSDPNGRTGDNTLTLKLTVPGKDTLTVNVEEEIQGLLRENKEYTGQTGTMILTVEQKGKTSNSETSTPEPSATEPPTTEPSTTPSYAMKLFFNVDEKHFPVVTKDDEEKVVKTETTFKITWHIKDIQIIGANRWKE